MTPRTIQLATLAIASGGVTACDSLEKARELLPSRGFYAASTSMEPTLPKGSQMMADEVTSEELRRGDILMVKTVHGENYVMRLIALPGDRIAMEAGHIVLNGTKFEQQPAGTWRIEDDTVGGDFAVFVDKLPGEATPHRILDQGPSPADEMAEITLDDDQYFLMGDNRDNSADSRFPDSMLGLGPVTPGQIRRRVDPSSIGYEI